ncbi:MAG: DUF4384 domain-containing protein [Syntrophorhabdaceae bacterium]
MKSFPSIVVVVFLALFIMCLPCSAAAGPSGAKAIFDSGEGPAVRMSTSTAKPATQTAAAPAREKYVGVSYKLVLLKDNGSFDMVSKSRTFRSGEKIKLLVRTNRPGYLTIMNIGTSGNSTVLCSEQVEPGAMIEIPKTGNFRFTGAPGTEKLLVMLSENPNPMAAPSQTVASAPPPAPSTASAPPPPPPVSSDVANLPPPPPPGVMTASLEGSKDITLEDGNQTRYAVVNPRNGWKAEPRGKKDIVLESAGGENFGVIPASYVQDGSILTLEIKLKHR